MATAIYADALAERSVRPSLVGRMVQHMMRAREAEAKRRIADHVYLVSDADLENVGLTREEVMSWRHPRGL